MKRSREIRGLIAAAACFMVLCAAHAQEGQKPAEPPKQPTLDELLGIAPAKPAAKPEEGAAKPEEKPPAAEDPTRTALERRLTAQQVSEQFEEAVVLMGDTARRLSVARDTGIETQRLQDEIIRKLDMLIQMAEQQQQQQQQQQRSSSRQRDQQQQPSQPQQAQRQDQQTGDPDNAEGLPAGQSPDLSPEIAARGAAWGNLPERVRDALLQGNSDRYSRRWQHLTEAYYRRLAEEGNR